MKSKIALIIIILAILIVAIVSWLAVPTWRTMEYGWVVLLGIVVVSVVTTARNVISIFKELKEISTQTDPQAGDPTQVIADKIEQSGDVNIVAQELHAEQIGGQRTTIGQYHIHIPPPEAEILLPALPTQGEIPYPAPTPPGSRMIHSRNAVFAGRMDDLLTLANSLVFQEEPNRVCVNQMVAATGMGGIGKTQLAVEFCYRYGRFFEGVHWVSAFNRDITTEIAECGRAMSLPFWPEVLSEQIDLTLHAWSKSRRRLLVLDNLEEPELLRDWLPRLNHCRILITARRQEWPAEMGLFQYPLGLLGRVESLTLMRNLAERLQSIPNDRLEPIANRLGDLPLAIDLAGRYLKDCHVLSPEEFLAELDQEENLLDHKALHDWVEGSPTRHETSLVATFNLSWRQLGGDSTTNVRAKNIFQLAGWCAPNTPIPMKLLMQAVEAERESNFDRSLNRLYELGLLEKSDIGPLIHPLLAVFSRATAEVTDFSTLENIIGKLGELSSQAIQTGIPRNFLPYLPHIIKLCPIAEEYQLKDAATLWNNLGFHYRMVANLDGARDCHERGVNIAEKAFGLDHPELIGGLNNLSLVLKEQGDLAGARTYIERALKIAEATYGLEHSEIALFANNLGRVLQDQGELAAARPLFERAVKISEANYGIEHPEIAMFLNNYGRVLQDQGDPTNARLYIERALKIAKATFGPNHPDVATYINNIGGLLMDQGKLNEARRCFERAIRIDEVVFGPDHPNVALYIHNLGLVLRDHGDLSEAQQYFERALKIDENAFGQDHPKVAKDLHSLGGVLFKEGDLSGACALIDRAFKIALNVYGPEHPTTLRYRKSLNIMEQVLLEHLTRSTYLR